MDRSIFMTATTPTTQGGGGSLIQTNEFSYQCGLGFLAACNGLVMEITSSRTRSDEPTFFPHIINPATKQAFLLPPRPPCDAASHLCGSSHGMAYAPASMVYKVTASHSHSLGPMKGVSVSLEILTAGVGQDNSWRQVRADQLSKGDRSMFSCHKPLVTEGFMHWVQQIKGKRVVTLDMETEILTVSEAPVPLLQDHYRYHYLSTGRSLSLLAVVRGTENDVWELWEMNPETKEWTKLVDDIKLGAQQFAACLDDDLLTPVGWVKYPEVLAMEAGYDIGIFYYNLYTHEMEYSTDLTALSVRFHATAYKNSLIWIT